jgi:hypothetical protein
MIWGVLIGRYSDYEHLNEVDFSIVKAVDKGNYVMMTHKTMGDENKKLEKDYLHIMGN